MVAWFIKHIDTHTFYQLKVLSKKVVWEILGGFSEDSVSSAGTLYTPNDGAWRLFQRQVIHVLRNIENLMNEMVWAYIWRILSFRLGWSMHAQMYWEERWWGQLWHSVWGLWKSWWVFQPLHLKNNSSYFIIFMIHHIFKMITFPTYSKEVKRGRGWKGRKRGNIWHRVLYFWSET